MRQARADVPLQAVQFRDSRYSSGLGLAAPADLRDRGHRFAQASAVLCIRRVSSLAVRWVVVPWALVRERLLRERLRGRVLVPVRLRVGPASVMSRVA